MKYDYSFSNKHIQLISKYARFCKSAGLTAETIERIKDRAAAVIVYELDNADKHQIRPITPAVLIERTIANVLYGVQREGGEISDAVKILLLSFVQCNLHEGGKIEGVQSIDSTCLCDFCERMANSNNPDCICKHCYARRDAQSYKGNSINPRHMLTAFIFSNFEFSVEQLKALPLYAQNIRFNSDGDLYNSLHAVNYLRIAKAFPDLNFGFWFKNIAALIPAVQREGYTDNISFVYSDPIINGTGSTIDILKANSWIDYSFTVYKPSELKAALNAGAGICNGRKCRDCGYKCYTKKHEGKNIAEKLRG